MDTVIQLAFGVFAVLVLHAGTGYALREENIVAGTAVNETCFTGSPGESPSFGWFSAEGGQRVPVIMNETRNVHQALSTSISHGGLVYYLIIKSFNASTAKRYECDSHNSELKQTVIMSVAVPPEDIKVVLSENNILRTTNITEFVYNETDEKGYKLRCEPAGANHPAPSVNIASWNVTLNNGTQYLLPKEDFIDLALSRYASGNYTCLLQNSAGPPSPLRQSVRVTVQYPPSVHVEVPKPNDRLFAEGETLDITCASSDGLPTVNTFDVYFKKFSSNNSVSLKGVKDGKYYTLGHPLGKSDAGEYSCVSRNVAGSGSGSAIITVIVPPGPVRNLTLDETAQSEATLMWNAPEDNGGYNISQYKIACTTPVNGMPHITDHQVSADSSSEITATISGLLNGQTYNCCVAASNGFRKLPFGSPVYLQSNFTTQAGAPCEPIINVTNGMTNKLCVSWLVQCTGGLNLASCSLIREKHDGSDMRVLKSWAGTSSECGVGNDLSNTYCEASATQLSYFYYFRVTNRDGTATSKKVSMVIPTTSPTVSSTPTKPAEKSSSSSSNAGLIAGVVVAVVVVIVIGIVIVYFVWKGKQAGSGTNGTTVNWAKPDGGKGNKELNYANVQVSSASTAKPTKPASEPTTYASIDAQKTQAKARGDESGTSTVV